MISARLVMASLSVAALASVMVLACSSSSSSGDVISGIDAGAESASPEGDGGTTEGGANDAGSDALAGTCVGACKATALVADFGGKKRTLQRAQFGTEAGDGGTQLHTESHLGGDAACPTMSSPTPDYTLIVNAVPRAAVGRKLTERDGVTGAFFDFKGDLGLPPVTKAITMNVTVIGEDSATPPTWVALDVVAGFAEGNVTGHLYAAYCASLSQ